MMSINDGCYKVAFGSTTTHEGKLPTKGTYASMLFLSREGGAYYCGFVEYAKQQSYPLGGW